MENLSTALQSGSIFLREGVEALLIITALAAAMRRIGPGVSLRPVAWGTLGAVVASLLMAAVFQLFFDGVHNDFIEAGVMAVAAALMIYMSGWLFVRQDPKVFRRMIDRSAARARDDGTAWSLAAVSFLAVFREGAETVLFMHALASTSGASVAGILAGIAAALAALLLIYFAMQWLALRIPLRPLFVVTSAFLFVMGLRFIGGAVQELQEREVLGFDPSPMPEWLAGLGFNASWQAVGVQAVVLALLLAGLVPSMLRARLQPAPIAAE